MVKTTKEQIEEMKKLRTDGLLYTEISQIMGIGVDRISYYLNPNVKKRKMKEDLGK